MDDKVSMYSGAYITVNSNAVPEPSVFILLASGLGVLGVFSRVKKEK